MGNVIGINSVHDGKPNDQFSVLFDLICLTQLYAVSLVNTLYFHWDITFSPFLPPDLLVSFADTLLVPHLSDFRILVQPHPQSHP